MIVPFVLLVFDFGYASSTVAVPNMETCLAAKKAYIEHQVPPGKKGTWRDNTEIYENAIKCIPVGQ